MRIILIVAPAQRGSLTECAARLARGMESKGHRVDMKELPDYDGMSIPGYEYVAVLSEPTGFFSSKIPASIAKVLAQPSSLVGKRSAAFLRKRGLFGEKTLVRLMRTMEAEGMLVNWSEVIENEAQAEAFGKRLAD